MPNYQVVLTKTAQKQLKQLPSGVAQRIEDKLIELEENPRPSGCTKLTSRDAYRIRVGNYRVIYEVSDGILIVTVIRIAHRRNSY